MGWIKDALQEIPLSAVLKERVELADQRYQNAVEESARLEEENKQLLDRIQQLEEQLPVQLAQPAAKDSNAFEEVTLSVMRYLFEAEHPELQDLCVLLDLREGIAKYHLEQLEEHKFAVMSGINFSGDVYWSLTSDGRRYAVENAIVK